MSNIQQKNTAADFFKRLDEDKFMQELATVLPDHIAPKKFVRIVKTSLLKNPDLFNCTISSVVLAALMCAADGLVPDGREAAIVKYVNKDKATGGYIVKAQYLPMVYGLIKRMRNTSEVTKVNAHCIYENDAFSFQIVNGDEKVDHIPNLFGDRGKIVGVYAVVKIKDSDNHIEIMTKAEIDKTRAAGKAKDGFSPWVDWYDEMAKKAVIHRAAKRVPTSPDLDIMLHRSMRHDILGEEYETPLAIADNLPSKPTSKLALFEQETTSDDVVDFVKSSQSETVEDGALATLATPPPVDEPLEPKIFEPTTTKRDT